MTLPNGPDGVDTTKGLFLTSAHGYGTQSITDLVGNDEDYVKAVYKDRFIGGTDSVFGNPAGPLAQVFGGLAGLPGVISALVGKLLDVDLTDITDIGQLIDLVEKVPGTTQLITIIKDLTGVDLGTVFDGVNLTNPGAVLTAIETAIAGIVNGVIQAIIDRIFGGLASNGATGNPVEALTPVIQQLQNAVTAAMNSSANAFAVVSQFGAILQQLIDDVPDLPVYQDAQDFLEQIGQASGTLVGTAFTAASNLLLGFKNIFDQWFGGSGATGTPAEVAQAVESIRILTKDGYTLQTFVASNAAWPVPPDLAAAQVAWAGVIGGGGKGGTGQVGTGGTLAIGYGGLGGLDGGYVLVPFDPSTLGPTIAVTIGAAATTAGANGGLTTMNGLNSTPGISGISQPEGYQSSTSKPGTGGRGGDGWAVGGSAGPSTDGARGEPSAAAAGGTAGSAANGGNGASGSTSTVPIAGGSGGGGGGGRAGFGLGGYNGGNGGYPGGGSGGGGGVASTGGGGAGGVGGTPANGFAFLIWK